MRPITAFISQRALRHNLAVVKRHAPQAKIMAVVKANGYGHGLLNVAQGLTAADGFAVLGINEAITLREAGYRQTILLLEGVFAQDELVAVEQYALDVVVHCQQQLEMLLNAAIKQPVHVHLKMNTGMNRLGFTPEHYAVAFDALNASKNVSGITLMTHFATADELPGIETPLALFKQATQILPADLPISLANSATILRYSELAADWVRPGIMLYGASPMSGMPAASFNLKPVMQLHSEIIAVQTLNVGDSVGYGNRFTAEKPTRIGIVACGYADGYPRHAGLLGEPRGAPISVSGVSSRTIGRVSMDMLFCDLTHIPQADIGSPVELWGNQIAVDAVAEASGTVGYELLCALAPRVPVKLVD